MGGGGGGKLGVDILGCGTIMGSGGTLGMGAIWNLLRSWLLRFRTIELSREVDTEAVLRKRFDNFMKYARFFLDRVLAKKI